MSFNYEVIHGLDFTDDEIEETLRRGGLLSLELEFSKRCNLRCLYCYSSAGEPLKDELDFDEVCSVIDQAARLGAKKIILLGGGEPLLYGRLPEVIDYIRSRGLDQSLFTNGLLLTAELARFLAGRGVTVVVKHNSFSPRIQDSLAGVEGAYDRIRGAIENLFAAGYPAPSRQMGIQTVIVRQNIDEVPEMWRWARRRGVVPYFEILTLQGRAREHGELLVDNGEIKRVFERLRRIDNEEFSIDWNPHPTIASFTCRRHLYSTLVNSQGYVQPCTGIDIFVGNVRSQPLAEILRTSRVIQDLRNIHSKIEGPCGTCELSPDCYGCRGNAYQMTGNYLASDPKCWLGEERAGRGDGDGTSPLEDAPSCKYC
ncbi:MAG TPA: radical SAM protein [Deltaproteobacteria bacterium]|nr:radical SAM protein [Deltaproteobacteria bacterium]